MLSLRGILGIGQLSIADKRVWRAGMRHIQKQDPILGKVVKSIGPIDFEMDDGHYEALVGAIIYQQLPGARPGQFWTVSRKSMAEKSPHRNNTSQHPTASSEPPASPPRKHPTSKT